MMYEEGCNLGTGGKFSLRSSNALALYPASFVVIDFRLITSALSKCVMKAVSFSAAVSGSGRTMSFQRSIAVANTPDSSRTRWSFPMIVR